jgi:hypothetical protein
MQSDKDSLIEAAKAAVRATALTPSDRCVALLDDVARMDVHPAHDARFAALIAEFQNAAVGLVKLDSGAFDRAWRGWWERFWWGGFQTAPPEQSQMEVWHSHAKDQGWTTADVELLISLACREGAKIKQLNWQRAVISDGRIFTLRNLRLSQKSASSNVPDDIWLERFPPIRDPNAPVAPPPMVIGGAVASGPAVVISDRAVLDSTAGVKAD